MAVRDETGQRLDAVARQDLSTVLLLLLLGIVIWFLVRRLHRHKN